MTKKQQPGHFDVRKKMAQALRDDAIRMYNDGVRQAEIARRLKVSRQYVGQIVKEAGL